MGKGEEEVFGGSEKGAVFFEAAGGTEDAGFEQAEGAELFETAGEFQIFERMDLREAADHFKGLAGDKLRLVAEKPAEMLSA